MNQFWSCEEGFSILAAVISTVISVKLFKTTVMAGSAIGLLAALAVVYITFFEFTLTDDKIKYRNRFRETEFPLSYVQKASMSTFWAGLPGHTFMFIMRKPLADINGYFLRTGLSSWPSASSWIDAVNASIAEKSR